MQSTVLSWLILLSCVGAGLVITGLQPAVADTSLAPLRRLAIQHKGRIKPFETYARETLHQLTGSSRYQGRDAVQTVLSMMADADRWTGERIIALPYRPLRERLGFAANQASVSYNELVETRTLMRSLPAIVEKQERDESLSIMELETLDVFHRFVTLTGVIQHDVSIVPPRSGARTWGSLKSLDVPGEVATHWRNMLDLVDTKESNALAAGSQALVSSTRAINPGAYPARWRLELECWYYFLQPFRWAWLCYAFTVLAFLLSVTKASPLGTTLGWSGLWMAIGWHVLGIAMRVTLSGHPPVTNFYETMLWLPLVAVVLALVMEARSGTRYFVMSGSVIAFIALVLTEHVPLDPHIVPVVAVLRSNKWLMIHVLTIVASYGALALGTVLAHIYGIVYVRRGPSGPMLPYVDQYLYRTIQVGVMLLTAGIMLGGVWANASWGRYWGWDPKETWALITLIWFIAMLHGRIVGWLRGVGTSLATLVGFVLLMMTYYGVSFYMVGLHSYAGGNPKPLPIVLVAYLMLEVAFIGIVGWRAQAFRRIRPA